MFRLIAIALLLVQSLGAASYWIDPAGSNSNPGSEVSPWLTLDFALSTATSGDTINVKEGVYVAGAATDQDGITVIGPANTNAVIAGRLTVRHKDITLTRLTFETNYLLLKPTVAGGVSNVVVNYCKFEKATQGIYMQTVPGDDTQTNGVIFSLFHNNTFSNMLGDGCIVLNGMSNVVATNWFYRTPDWDAFRAWGIGNRISDNLFERFLSGAETGTGAHADIVQTFDNAAAVSTSKDIIFERNVIKECSNQFGNMEARNGSPNMGWWIFRNNIFWNSRIQINMIIPGMAFYNNTIYNNTSSSGFRFSSSTLPASDGRVINNLFVRVGAGIEGTGFYSFRPEATGTKIVSHNLITDRDDSAHTSFVLDSEGGINGGYTPTQIFVDPDNGDFRLAAGSPAIGAGTNLSSLFTQDYYGNNRGDVWSMGAIQDEAEAPSDPPAAPSGLTATATSFDRIELEWSNVAQESSYVIERKLGAGGTYATIATTSANTVTYQDTGLSELTQYYYRVRASNVAGDSAYSNEANATTLEDPDDPVTPPNTPSNLAALPVTTSQILVTWSDVETETSYTLERKTGFLGEWSVVATKSANVTAHADTGLYGELVYYYRIKSSNAVGDSSYSSEVSGSPFYTAQTNPGKPKSAAHKRRH